MGTTQSTGNTETLEDIGRHRFENRQLRNRQVMGTTQSTGNTETLEDIGDKKTQLSLLLMGKSGHGKSSLGNSLLGYETFKVSSDINSQTAEVTNAYSEFESCSLMVVDGPGLQDTELSELEDKERAVLSMSKSLTMCSGGVDAFLFVFRYGGRFTPEEFTVLKTLSVIFGQDYLKHAIVVLTYGDQFDKEEITFDDWCKRQTGPFRELYDACDGRFVLFNNKEKDEENQIEQREQLTQLVQGLKSRLGCYTANCFKLAASQRQEMITTLKLPILKERIQKQAGILFSKIEKYRKQPCAEQKAEIRRGIRTLKNEIQTEDNSLGSLKDLMKIAEDIENHLHDTAELCRLGGWLEFIRKAERFWSETVIHKIVIIGPLGTLIMEYVETITVTKISHIQTNMSIRNVASHAT